ncbi:MAG: nitroreductase family protein [Paludibacteraceae bacterium]|nr:nitroreductase family protein [Paludibacteraceae bacterium]
MNTFNELAKTRRSIRKFQDRPVEEDKLKNILKAALMAPSSKRCQPWQFVVVDEQEKLLQMSVCREMGCKFLDGAPAAIIVLAEESLSDVWVEDASIAAAYMQLAAEDLGLGSCWIQVRNRMKSDNQTTEDYLKEIINAPEGLRIECIIAIGYKNEEKNPFDETRLKWDKVKKNSF